MNRIFINIFNGIVIFIKRVLCKLRKKSRISVIRIILEMILFFRFDICLWVLFDWLLNKLMFKLVGKVVFWDFVRIFLSLLVVESRFFFCFLIILMEIIGFWLVCVIFVWFL